MSSLRFLTLSFMILGSTVVAISTLVVQPQLAELPVAHLMLTPSDQSEADTPRPPHVVQALLRAAEGGDDRLPDFPASVTIAILQNLAPGPPKAQAAKPAAAGSVQALAGLRAEVVAARLRTHLTAEMLKHFDLFLYVSKADRGPLAQRMYVFQKRPGNELKLAYDWAASTGREQAEVNARGRLVFTATPSGYYQLDPQRIYRSYHSTNWDQDMPNAMFFDWQKSGRRTGLAIHAAQGNDIAELGSRGSAGCVHLAPENAATLFELIRAEYQGSVPRFAFDRQTRTISNQGVFMRASHGELEMAEGYRVLIMIENFGGEGILTALL